MLDSYLGKIIRIQPDGEAPADNPWIGVKGALPMIWSLGHRNQQAISVAPNGKVYAHEHGPEGGDEINVIEKGNNYGWPVITYGNDYDGASITPYTEYAGMQQPFVDWTPSIAPAGMTYYTGDQFPEWQGDLFAVSLKQKSVRRIDLENGKVISDTPIFPELDQRMRDIRTGPDGVLYVLTDGNNGKLLRISRR
jgi:glucose/arabinose dehydrogenase